MARNPTDGTRTDRHPAQWLALVIGVLFLLVGLTGFLITGFDGFVEPDGGLLLGIFEVNPLHNVVHLVIGAAGIALWNRLDQARIYGWLLLIGYGATFLFGLFVAGSDDPINFLALNAGDNVLHIASALAGLAIVLWPAKDRAGAARATDTDAVRRRR
jgi:ABC-type transport system involved in multi-copper enzyme maturation permease subunit